MKFDKKYWPETVHGRWIEDNGIHQLVSVIVPTYNREAYILETLESIYSQVYRPIELIVVDDGSTDKTAELMSKWFEMRECDDFICKFFSQDNQGAPVARNRGVIECKGEFIQFLDSDDWLDSRKLKVQVDYLTSQPKADVAIGSTFWAKGNERIPYKAINSEKSKSTSQIVHYQSIMSFCTMSPLYRRQTVSEIGPWFEALECCQDTEYGNRLFASGATVHNTPEAKSFYRQDHASTDRLGYEYAPDRRTRYARNSLRRLCLFWEYLPTNEKVRPEIREEFSQGFYEHILNLEDPQFAQIVSESVQKWKEVLNGTSFAFTGRAAYLLIRLLGCPLGLFFFFKLWHLHQWLSSLTDSPSHKT